MSTLAQRNFAAGEVAPSVYARTDQVKYQTGARTVRNFMVRRQGGLDSRPGTTFSGEVKDSTKTVRLIPFVFNSAQTYMLEFGDVYMRLHKNGNQVTEATKAITGASQANPCSITAVGHGYSTGDEVYITGILGMTQLNGRNFKVVNTGANTFTLKYMDGSVVDSSAFTAYVSGGTAARIYTIVSPYAVADLPALRFAESADVITITHPSYPTYNLSRTSDTSWSFALETFSPSQAQPGASVLAGTAGITTTVYYKVTAVAANGEESLPGAGSQPPLSAISLGAQITITMNVSLVASTLVNGDEVFLYGIGGTKELNGNVYIVSDATATTFKLKDSTGAYVDGSTFTAFTFGGTIIQQTIKVLSGGAATVGAPNVITATTDKNVKFCNVYKAVNGIYGFIGSAYSLNGAFTFNDTGATPDTTDQPPVYTNIFPSVNNYPACVGYFQQRRIYANLNSNTEKVFSSKIGNYKNFTTSKPSHSDDSVQFTIAGAQVNAVKHLLELGTLIVFTQAGEWSINGDSSGALTPTGINPKQHSYCGSSDLRPLIIDSTAVFVQARGNRVRDLAFDWQVNGYRGNDLSIFSAHLFDGFSLVDWTFSQIPNSIIWCARSDGAMIGMTYIREQQIWGWHRHDFDGTVENVCSIPEGGEDFLYLVIKRTINGATKRYVERMASRLVGNIVDYIGVDCSLGYDGRNLDVTKTMTLSGGTNWDNTENLTLTANAAQFLSTDVGNGVNITGSDGTLIRCVISAYSSSTVVTVSPNKTVPVGMRTVAIGTWAKAVKTLGGLWHLEGKSISALCDGFVVGNPNNLSNNAIVVASGKAVLDKPYSVIHAGLPIICDFESLDPDVSQGETMVDKKKLIGKITVVVEKSRGIFAGAKAPDPAGADPINNLAEYKIRGDAGENYDDPIALRTGTAEIVVAPSWNQNGRIFIRQIDPVPLSILAVMPAGYFPVRS